jgi:hypothetical protein
MILFYLRNRWTGEVVTFDSGYNEEGSWVELDYGYSNPYFNREDILKKIASGETKSTWSVEISNCIQKDAEEGLLEVIEVEL